MRMLLVASMLVAAAAACSREATEASDESVEADVELIEIGVGDVERLLAAGEITLLDANTPRTRNRLGVVPGAVLLSDFETYELSELPADKSRPLVFYCTNDF